MLGHDHDEDLVVGPGVIGRGVRVEVGGMERSANRTLADGAVAGGSHDGFGFGARIDHGHDDAPRADVEHTFDVLDAVDGNAHERGDVGVGQRDDAGAGRFHVHGRVLELEGEPVEAHARHELRGGDAGHGEPGAEGGLALFQFVANEVLFHFNAKFMT
jgi:hypothetical protein